MAVPGHDERDFVFAKKFSLPIRKVILEKGKEETEELEEAFTGIGTMVNSDQFNEMDSMNVLKRFLNLLKNKILAVKQLIIDYEIG